MSIKIPEIDRELGIGCYCTDGAGCGGRIRSEPGHFAVTERISDRAIKSMSGEVGYPVYRLVKTGVDTRHAVSKITKDTGMVLYPMGLKDANATTTQYLYSKKKIAAPKTVTGDRYAMELAGYARHPLSKRDMTGNHFCIRITGGAAASIEPLKQDILNFYGYQRFGSARPVNHLVGRAIIQRRYGAAVDYVLSYPSRYGDKNAKIREMLRDVDGLGKNLHLIPPGMDIERAVALEMSKSKNPLKAVRAMPLQMRRFYVQSYQSYLFNLTITRAFRTGEGFAPEEGDVCYDRAANLGRYESGLDQTLAVPMVGHSYYKKTRFHHYVAKILDEEEIEPRDFYIKEIQEASAEGGFRRALMNVQNPTSDGTAVSFVLSRGSYATIAMREVIKPEDPIAAGF